MNPVLHLHIPRTAGSNVQSRLHTALKRFGRCLEHTDDLATALGHDASDVALVSGHFAWGVHEQLPGPATYFVVLRDPVDRVASLYDFIRDRGSDAQRELYAELSLHALMTGPDVLSTQFSNGHVRLLCGPDAVGRALGRKDLERAWNNLLGRDVVVTLADEVSEGLEELGARLGLDLGPLETGVNAAPRRPLDRKTRAAVERANALDLELWRRARAVFSGRYPAAQAARLQRQAFAETGEALERLAERATGERFEGRPVVAVAAIGNALEKALARAESAARERTRADGLHAEIQSRDAKIAGLKASVDRLTAGVTQARTNADVAAKSAEEARERAAALRAAVVEARQALSAARSETAVATKALRAAEAGKATADARAAALEARIDEAAAARARTTEKIAALNKALDAHRSALQKAGEERGVLIAKLRTANDALAAHRTTLARLEAERGEVVAASQARVAALTQALDAHRAALDKLKPRDGTDDQTGPTTQVDTAPSEPEPTSSGGAEEASPAEAPPVLAA